ncbi:large conductance mechanosensitive channel protein MscL [Convivina intestini]|uniref:Large-conductance mechanosensitive channel n=1 Tax=Convivina intestini TaxID=1505726 RepID=A0A2U1D6B6_9LACO|nr:large conductance mechanosensitive channel protein MscL [Convivina intestini]PVY83082.1 large conductance mechanosensitive channel [Convivina intestini]CAH1856577.1 Large-conductance mechanosensitive channel [Convivina intestini]SDB98277.1 large conductance mechanosensitive channel [Leuconostocaceae bacterium R-53105]
MKNFFNEFKTFITKGNIFDLAVGVIVGTAFVALVKSLTTNLINPLIGVFTGQASSLSNLKLVVTDNLVFSYGAFLNDFINFLITALVVFVLVKIINKYMIKPKEETTKPNQELLVLQEIRDIIANSK